EEHIKANAQAQDRINKLGFDPLKDLDSVAIAAAGAEDQDQLLVVARGKFDVAKFSEEAKKRAQEEKDKFKVHMVDGNTIYEAVMENLPKPLFVGMLDGNTIVAGLKQSDVADAFAIKAGKKKASVKKELQSLLEKANAGQSVSVVALGAALGNGIPF